MAENGLLPERRSLEGITALLGAYGSEEEEEEEEEQGGNAHIVQQGTQVTLSPTGPAVVETIRVVEQATDASTDPSQSPLPALRGADAAPEPADGTESAAEGRHLGGQRGEQDELWLPPDIAEEPPGLCPQNVQEIVRDIAKKQEINKKTITASLKAIRGYRNPDFLSHCVKYDGIIEFGSCYPPDIFDPYNLPQEDYYDRLAAEWNLSDQNRREERAKRQAVDFQSRGVEKQKAHAPYREAAASRSHAESIANKIGRSSKWDTKRSL